MRGGVVRGGVGRRVGCALRAPALGAALALATDAGAQVVLDGSLGAGEIPFDGTTWDVTEDLGRRSGSNLYHSLSIFDVGLGETARFSTSAEIMFVRVTGGDGSDNLGRWEFEAPNNFLIDPNGFHFGPESSIGALGSVYVSSADLIRFGDDPPFDARSSAPPAVLSAAPPTAFGFLGGAPAAEIALDLDRAGTPLDFPVPPGETLALVGGDVRVLGPSAGPGSVPTVRIEGGSIEIAAVGSAAVDVPVDVASFDARSQPAGALGEVELGRNANLDVQSPLGSPVGAGRVVIRGGRLVVDDARITSLAGSHLAGSPVAVDLETSDEVAVRAGSRLTVVSVDAPVGDLRIDSERVGIEGGGTLVTAIARGAGEAPDVVIDAGELSIRDGAQVQLRTTQPDAAATGGRFTARAETATVEGGAVVLSQTASEATGGAIDFDVETLRVAGGGVVKSESAAGAGGTGGAIEIDARTLRVETQGQIASENQDTGPGGAISVRAADEVSLASRGKIVSEATGEASGAGGGVRVEAGGRIVVVGEDSTDADVTQISALTSSSAPEGRGGGDLTLSAPLVELRDGGQVRTTTNGAAPGGSLTVEDTDFLHVVGNATVDGVLSGAGLFARVAPGASGQGGALTIEARTVLVEDGGEVSTRTLGTGDAGRLLIRDAASVVVRGGPRGVSTLSSRGGAGAGGGLEIDLSATGGTLELASGGIVSASTAGSGDGGDLRVAADRVFVSGASGLFSQSIQGSGAAGDIEVAVGSWLIVRDGGQISVSSLTGGNAGDVVIHGGPGGTPTLALVGGSVLARSAGSAEAGDIRIQTGGDFVAGAGASVATDATANQAGGGQVEISAGGILYLSDALIETQVEIGSGNGGDLEAPASGDPQPRLGVLNRSGIFATAADGNGGNIDVAANDLLASQGAVVDATSERGVAGVVEITGPDADLAGQIVPLPTNFFDAAKLMTTACDARRARTGSFVIQTGRGIGPPPDAPLTASELSPSDGGARAGGPADARCPG